VEHWNTTVVQVLLTRKMFYGQCYDSGNIFAGKKIGRKIGECDSEYRNKKLIIILGFQIIANFLQIIGEN
jgi:hypothetical protein